MSLPHIHHRRPKGGGLLTTASTVDEPIASTSRIELNGQISRAPAEAAAGERPLFRAASVDSLTIDDDDDIYARPPLPKKQRKAPAPTAKAKGKAAYKGKGKQKELFVPSVPFPPHFVKLEQVYKVSSASTVSIALR
jgi:DEAD/DEAH box helicase domain-containing protein